MDYGHKITTLELYDRLLDGKKVSENHWDYNIIPKNASRMKEKYKIRFGDKIIPDNHDLTDKLFAAGVEMLTTTGFYCPDLGKRLTVTEEEILEGIERAPRKVKQGSGNDASYVEARHGSARRRPFVYGGPTATPISEDIYMKVMQSYAQENIVDALFNGTLNTLSGTKYKPNTPYEIYAVMREIKYSDMARTNCGRPGLAMLGPESGLSTGSRISAGLPNFGLRPCDARDIPQRNEMKIDYICLNMLTSSAINGDVIMCEELPIFGGYCGGAEETAICDVAMSLASFVLFGADMHTDGPIHIRWGVTTSRDTLKVLAHTAVALDTNTDVLLGSMYYTHAGPSTEMCYLENAAQAIVDAVTGREYIMSCASAKGVELDRVTGMEARFAGKAAQSAAGISVHEANEILDELTMYYEPLYGTTMEGKTFQECYDMETLRPLDDAVKVYSRAVERVRDLGLDMHF